MNQQQLPDQQLLMAIATLEARARAADSLNGLAFSIVNDPYPLLGFRQALIFDCTTATWSLLAVSGLAQPTEDSPYLVWLRQASKWISSIPMPQGIAWITHDSVNLPKDISAGWEEWWPTGIWCLQIIDREKHLLGVVIFLLDTPPDQTLASQFCRLTETWSYCWGALIQHRQSWRWQPTLRLKVLIALMLVIFFLLPVRQTALAPAEVVALNATVVASPLDGVIKKLYVQPNQAVKKGELLYSLDETTLHNRLEVTLKSVAVADAELNAITQRSFDNASSRNEIALLTGRAQERRAELYAIQAQLARIDVSAPRDGVAVFGDPNDWLGKPVVTGERVMLLADPATPTMLINLPVADAISLERGALVRLYLSAHPLSSINGRITETSYQAITTSDGIAAYRLRASIDSSAADARLGLRGTAKVYGERVVLGYYILRRPLATLRSWSGL